MGAPNQGAIYTLDSLQIISFLLLTPTILTAAFSRRVHRSATWFSYLASCILTAVGSLLIAGQQVGPPPPFSLCLFQSAVLYASPVYNATTGLAFIIQVHIVIVGAITHPDRDIKSNYVRILVAAPIFFLVAVFVESLTYGLLHQQSVQRDSTGISCHITDPIVAGISAGLVMTCMVTMLLFDALVIRLVYRNWVVVQKLQNNPFIHPNNRISFTALLRVVIVGFMTITALVLSLWSWFSEATVMFHLVLALLPVSVGLALGLQKDVVKVWMFWRTPNRLEAVPKFTGRIPEIEVATQAAHQKSQV